MVTQVLQELKVSQENHHSVVPKEKQVNQVRKIPLFIVSLKIKQIVSRNF
jgi:hypothetical protein